MQVYLDTAPVIYLVENVAPWEAKVRAFLSEPGMSLCASVLTRMECRVVPLRADDQALLADYEFFFSSLPGGLVEMHGRIFERAAEIRASPGFKTPDALHLAAAIWNGFDVFLTNDRNLKRCPGIKVEVLEL